MQCRALYRPATAASPEGGKDVAVVVVGVDAHKRSHTMVAVDGRGRKLAEKTVPATSAGHTQALRWALSVFDGETTTWGVEDVRSVTARLERDLMDAGAVVVRVPASVVAQVRGSAREVGKSDPIDALAVARAVLQDPNLPEHDTTQIHWLASSWWIAATRWSSDGLPP